jgi:hypothetical protein
VPGTGEPDVARMREVNPFGSIAPLASGGLLPEGGAEGGDADGEGAAAQEGPTVHEVLLR